MVLVIFEEEGEVHRTPDHAVIELPLREQVCDAGATLLDLRTRVDGVIDALKQNGIDEKYIASQRLNVRQDYSHDQKKHEPGDYIAIT